MLYSRMISINTQKSGSLALTGSPKYASDVYSKWTFLKFPKKYQITYVFYSDCDRFFGNFKNIHLLYTPDAYFEDPVNARDPDFCVMGMWW